MIKNGQVYGSTEFKVPNDLTFGVHVIKRLKEKYKEVDKIALINGKTDKQITYKDLVDKIARISSGLRRLGIKRDDVVGVCSENCSVYLAVTIAASMVGAVVTFINAKYCEDETRHVVNISKPILVFCSKTSLSRKLDIFLQTTSIKHIVQLNGDVTDDCVTSLTALETVCINSDNDIANGESERVSAGEDTAFIFYSSGTTGLPKGVMLTHRNVLYGTAIYNYENQHTDIVLTILPWSHVYGLLSTIHYLVSGNLVVYLNELIPEQYLATIEKYHITEIPAVPPMVHVFSKSSLVDKYDISSIKCILSAAASLSADVINDARKNLPNCKGIYQGYGMTETTLFVLKQPFSNENRIMGGCGVPLPGITAKVVDIETRKKLGPNEQGEVCFKGPSIMKGYVDNNEATKNMFDEEGFMKSGDVGYYDEDGCFYIVDRLKEIIKYKGYQVAPAMVESVIMKHDGVAECGVVGKPDESAGELPTGFVVKKPGATLTEEELLQFTSTRLSPMSKLRGGVIFVEEIPKNGTGKILRRELRNKLIQIKRPGL